MVEMYGAAPVHNNLASNTCRDSYVAPTLGQEDGARWCSLVAGIKDRHIGEGVRYIEDQFGCLVLKQSALRQVLRGNVNRDDTEHPPGSYHSSVYPCLASQPLCVTSCPSCVPLLSSFAFPVDPCLAPHPVTIPLSLISLPMFTPVSPLNPCIQNPCLQSTPGLPPPYQTNPLTHTHSHKTHSVLLPPPPYHPPQSSRPLRHLPSSSPPPLVLPPSPRHAPCLVVPGGRRDKRYTQRADSQVPSLPRLDNYPRRARRLSRRRRRRRQVRRPHWDKKARIYCAVVSGAEVSVRKQDVQGRIHGVPGYEAR
ncbi:hypothetical protein O3P69_014057 [Scylla paramamosain]|uniref:Uncharacterized protein n=1 Tax=Scylla paramamosain TaxID=85552 RepID=A0AAW0SR30_SCYPA